MTGWHFFQFVYTFLPMLGQSIIGQGLLNDIDRPLPEGDKFSNSNIYNVYISWRKNVSREYIHEQFYVNKLIKAEAERFLERFFLDYPLYIFGGWRGCGERYAGLSELISLNFIFKQPVKRLVKFPLEALIKDMAEEGKPYISW